MKVKNILMSIILICIKECMQYPFHFEKDDATTVPTNNPAKVGQFPYQALIRLKYTDNYPLCSAVIVHKNYVITAADCVEEFVSEEDDLEVVAGGTNAESTMETDNGLQLKNVTKIIIHPQYSRKENANIALVKTDNEFVQTPNVTIADYGIAKIGQLANISTWLESDDLQWRTLKIYQPQKCKIKSDDIFCAGEVDSENFFTDQCGFEYKRVVRGQITTPSIVTKQAIQWSCYIAVFII